MQVMAVVAAEVPVAAKVFTAICGLGFLVAGVTFASRPRQVAEFGRKLAVRTGQALPEVRPTSHQVRVFGVGFLVVGVLLISLALFLMAA